MPKNLIMVLGILVAVMPYVSVPSSMKNPLYTALGALIATIFYREKNLKRKNAQGVLQKRIRRPVGPITPLSREEVKPLENEPKDGQKET